MKRIGIFLAEGFEEIEALTVADICRRCGLDVQLVSVSEERWVSGSHGITGGSDIFSGRFFGGGYGGIARGDARDEESGSP